MNKIILEDFNEGDGYYKVNLAYLNKKQVEEIEALVSKWKPTDEDIINCIGMCLTDANEQRFKDYGTNLKECLAWLEKQGLSTFDKCHQEGDRIVENSDGTHFNISQLERVAKVEPKFHEGDWIVNNNSEGVCQVTEIRDDEYCLWPLDAEIMGYLRIIDVDNDYHLWTIQDAKSGDILSSKDKSNILIFRNLDTSTSFSSYYNIAGKGELGWSNNCFIPATKEQRNLLFQKMKEAGYEWDAEKKELRKMEQKSKWSENDEDNLNMAIYFMRSENTPYSPTDVEPVVEWLCGLKQRMEK